MERPASSFLVPKTDPRLPRCQHHVVRWIYPLRHAKSLVDRNRDDVRRLQRAHMTPSLVGDGPHRRAAESRREEPIVSGGHPAPLEMAEHERARLFPGDALNLASDRVAHAAEPASFAR